MLFSYVFLFFLFCSNEMKGNTMELVYPQLMCSCGAHVFVRRQDYPAGISPAEINELFVPY
jgi:hypothetical protein